MSKTTIKFIFLAIMLIAVQVVVFNHIALLGHAVGFIFIYTLQIGRASRRERVCQYV